MVELTGVVRISRLENAPFTGKTQGGNGLKKVVVIGAGIGGLSTAAVLARSGFEVTVLEAHVYPGGTAGTFYHQGYRFDVGATLAGGFYPGGPMNLLGEAVGIERWPAFSENPALVVHLPGGSEIARWSDERRWAERRAAFGRDSLSFWRWQEETASAIWDLALRLPSWPIQSPADLIHTAGTGLGWLRDNLPALHTYRIIADAFRPVAAHLAGMPDNLRLFIDAQLLISAQATSEHANALYGAAALDLPMRGTVHMEGGMGSIANSLVEAVRENGGKVLYRQEAVKIRMISGQQAAVDTKRGDSFPADLLVANLTPWDLKRLLVDQYPKQLRNLPERPKRGWGAFMVYAGIDDSLVPQGFPLHHQVVLGRPLGEGNTTFLSISPAQDRRRAPAGRRAVTISTHTDMKTWWELHDRDQDAYEKMRNRYAERLLAAAEIALPDFKDGTDLVMPGTPVTFQRFTRRSYGWVGGFPQTSLFRSWGPQISRNIWMVGDSIFPGQSVAASALGGMRVASAILRLEKAPLPQINSKLSMEVES